MPRKLGELSERVIVITGASSGIGAATAFECARSGMKVVLSARRLELLQEVASKVRHVGSEAHLVVGDVTEPGISGRMIDAAQEQFGRLDAVFANAGYGYQRAAVDLGNNDLRRIFDVNFFAAVDLLREAARRLMAVGGGGHLLMCSSCLAKFTLPRYSAYSATKAAQSHVCAAMRIELAPHSIYVSSVHPVTTATEFFEVSRRLSGGGTPPGSVPDHTPKWFVQSPQRVARAVGKCWRRPRPEVWTSFTVRAVAGVMTIVPSFADLILRQAEKKDRKEM